jgi:hypothetical protein
MGYGAPAARASATGKSHPVPEGRATGICEEAIEMTISKSQIARLSEKLQRLAYELEYDARRLRECRPAYADGLNQISHRLGDIGRGLHHEGSQP